MIRIRSLEPDCLGSNLSFVTNSCAILDKLFNLSVSVSFERIKESIHVKCLPSAGPIICIS